MQRCFLFQKDDIMKHYHYHPSWNSLALRFLGTLINNN